MQVIEIKRKLGRIVGMILGANSLLILIGHFYKISILTHGLIPIDPSMSVSAALMFLIIGIALIFLVEESPIPPCGPGCKVK